MHDGVLALVFGLGILCAQVVLGYVNKGCVKPQAAWFGLILHKIMHYKNTVSKQFFPPFSIDVYRCNLGLIHTIHRHLQLPLLSSLIINTNNNPFGNTNNKVIMVG